MPRFPSLVELPNEIPETAVWPELSAQLGSDANEIGPLERRWLTIATLHRSALNQNRESLAAVSRECLSLLEGIGNAVLELELRMTIYRQAPEGGVTQRNNEKARLIVPTRRAMIELLGVVDNARLGKGERLQLTHGRATRSVETVTLQLLGWWSLILRGDHIRRTIQHAYTAVVSDAVIGADWRMRFLQRFGKLSPQFSYTRQGPDDEPMFEATVTTQDGQSGTGAAARKKDATQLACHSYLAAYAPQELRPPVAGRLPAPPELPIHVKHQQLAALFGVPDAGLFSQACTHKSWAYENTVHQDPRASNEVLSNLGCAVLGLVVVRAKAAHLLSESTQPDPDLATVLALPAEDLVPLGHALDLPAASRLGAGEHKLGLTTDMLANAVQAVLAAAYLQVSDVIVFEERMPAVVLDFLRAHSGRSTRDAATRLQELATELDLEWTWTDRRTGPDHATTYHNTMRITGGSTTVVVEGSGPTRTAAKKAAAAAAIEAVGLRSGSVGFASRPDLARFFLARQLEVLVAKPNRWPRWQQHNVLGAGHVAERDWAAFARWVDAVQRTGLLDMAIPRTTRESVADYYQRAAGSAGARPHFSAALSRVLRWVHSAVEDDRQILASEPWDELVALTAAHGVWLAADGTTDLTDVVRRWARPERRRADVRIDVEGPAETGVQAGAAVHRLLQEFRPSATTSHSDLQATLVPGVSTHEIRLSPTGWSPGSTSLVTMVCEAAIGVVVEQLSSGTVLRIPGREPTGSGWLWDAARRTHATDETDVELARLLHDLKNEVTGARVALGRPATTRTERLEASLDASRHIDSAAAIATQLVDAELLYNAARVGSCDLASFLRGYSSDLLNRLPPGIRVIPPVTAPAHVAVSVDVIRGALDNLVKNAVEEMGDSGQIEFDYTIVEGDDVALLEVRDTGSGLPDDVVAALQTNGPVPTSKRHGSGLGLPGVMRMMRRAGGDLDPLHTASGGAWLIRLPLASGDGEPT
jgi:dsRNA-specific ribonuclease